MYCSTRTFKYILYVLNIFCLILGSILIEFGVWLLNSIEEVKIDHGEKLAAILTITLGTVVLLTALFGCVAVYMEGRSMLISYAVILVILLVIQLIMISIAHTATGDAVPSGIQNGFDQLWDVEQYGKNNTLSYYEEWLQCCGKNSAVDYYHLEQVPPSSCCKDRNCEILKNLNIVGCEQRFKEYVSEKTTKFNTISWLLIAIEFVASICACVLVDSIRNHRDRVRFYS